MRRKVMTTLFALASLLPAGPAQANDGFMGLPAGGLTLQKSADIRMLDEDLFISADEIRVNYRFRNDSTAPITAQVGFPMPGLPASINFDDAESGYDLRGVKGLDVLQFTTLVEGRRIEPRPVVRAFMFGSQVDDANKDTFRFTDGTDVTAELLAAGMPLSFDPSAIRRAFARMPANRQADWVRRGLYSRADGFEAPSWWLSTIFVRDQVFPPGRTVSVQHRYKPYPSGFIMVREHLANDPELVEKACVDTQTRRAIDRMLGATGSAFGREIDYVLTTARTWKGPIGHFRLTVDKGLPRNIVSFCGKGVRKTGPTTFAWEANGFSPDLDLKVLLVQGAN